MSMPSFRTSTPHVIDAIEETQPVLFRAFYPRRYDNLGGYYSPRLVAANLTCIATYSAGHSTDKLTIVEKLVAPSLRYMSDHRMPLMFLDAKFLTAVLMSDFPDPIPWPDLKLPYEHGIFMVPKGTLLTPEGHDIAFIHYSRKRRGECFPLPGRHEYMCTGTTISLSAMAPASDVWYNSNLLAEATPFIKLRDLYAGYNGHPVPGFDEGNPLFDHNLTPEDEDFVRRIGTAVFGTFLALNARPALFRQGQHQRTISNKHHDHRSEYWSPNIIGAGYEPKRHDDPKSTHASPRMHWRRGHFRNQACGHGYTEHKIIWIEPCLISGGETQ